MAVIQAQCPHWVHVGLQHVEVDSYRHDPNNGFHSCPRNEDQTAFEGGGQSSVLGKIAYLEEGAGDDKEGGDDGALLHGGVGQGARLVGAHHALI